MNEVTTMKKCCGLCPYSRKNTLYLNPDRAMEFAYQADNPYTDFVCHKTGITLEDIGNGDEREGDIVRGEKSLTCAGFHAMQSLVNDGECEIDIDITDHFSDPYEMVEHHELEYYKNKNNE